MKPDSFLIYHNELLYLGENWYIIDFEKNRNEIKMKKREDVSYGRKCLFYFS